MRQPPYPRVMSPAQLIIVFSKEKKGLKHGPSSRHHSAIQDLKDYLFFVVLVLQTVTRNGRRGWFLAGHKLFLK